MRWTHLYMGLMATAVGFGAVVTYAEDSPDFVPASLAAIAFGIAAAALYLSGRTRRVVLVGPRGEEPLIRLREALDAGGFRVTSCPGPARRPCPALEGKPCPVHGARVGVVVYRLPGAAVTPCGAALGVVEVDLDSTVAAPLFGDGRVVLPAKKGPDSAVRNLRALIAHHPSASRAFIGEEGDARSFG